MHLKDLDHDALMRALATAINQIDLIHDLLPEVELEESRRALMCLYLDVLAQRVRPYDRLAGGELPHDVASDPRW